MRSYSILMCLSIAVIANAFGASGEFNPVRHRPTTASGPDMQRVIVKLRAAAASDLVPLTQRTQLALKESHPIAGRLHVMQVTPAAGESVAATLARLRADPAVEYAEVDQRRYAHALPNDPLYTGQWYLQNDSTTPSAVNAVTAWDSTTGSSGIVIADLDTGVRYDHPDLLRAGAGGRLLPGYDFISNLATANDGNARDADASDPGDWISTADVSTTNFSACTVSDSSWHGTRVAGILGAVTNNAIGVAGLTWDSWLLPVRVLGKCGGFDSDIVEAMLWAAGLHVAGIPDNPYPAQIENLSLGGAGACPQIYRDAITQLTAIGVLVVASAGNEGGPVDAPANCSGVAGIAGLRHIGTKVGYSSLGPEIVLSSPAGNCVNTTPPPCTYPIDTTYNIGTTTPSTNAYTDQNNFNIGTSFSAPIVSGIAALMKSVNGNLNSSQLIARLRDSATVFPVSSDTSIPTCHVPVSATDLQSSECNCTTQTCGAGMANAANAVIAALRPIAAISAPTNVAAGQNVVLQGGGSAAACHHGVSAYSWSIVNGGSTPPGISGANTATATVTAPTSGAYTVRLTVTDDAGRQDTADVVLSPNAAATTAPAVAGSNACLSVTVSTVPASASVQSGIGTQAFTATVRNTIDLAVIWQVNNVTGGNATVGTISTSGLYTAPTSVPSPATVTVTAVSVADSSRSGTAQVTVTPAPTASSGGGGAIDVLTLLAVVLMAARRMTGKN